MAFFSIITINRNNRSGLAQTIASVRMQTLDDFEYIVIDGYSDDGSAEVLKQNEDIIDYWVSESDSGVYNAMNKGLKRATGEYVLFLNSGDELKSVESLNKIQQKCGGKDIVYCDVELVGGKNGAFKTHPDHITTAFLLTGMICHQAIFAKRDLFDRTGPFRENYKVYGDYEWILRAIRVHHASTRHIARVLVKYQAEGLSNTTSVAIQRKEKDEIHSDYFSKALVAVYRLYRSFNDWLDGNVEPKTE